MAAPPRSTRLAPSPTGALHLGNARTFLITWAIARQRGWRISLRIEDLDTPRTKPGAALQAIDDMRWLGIDWDDGPITQSDDLSPYVRAMDHLAARTLVYPCALTRSQVLQAGSAPQQGSHEVYFSPTLRTPEADRPISFSPVHPVPLVSREVSSSAANDATSVGWRFVVRDTDICFTDVIAGAQTFNPSKRTGDFVVWTKQDQPAYQLAVVVDDHRQHITDIIRGDDLLESTSRQILLARALHDVSHGVEKKTPEAPSTLSASPIPLAPRQHEAQTHSESQEQIHYWHLPMVVGPDGRRLAKRHGDSRIAMYRDTGVPAERVIGLIAAWSGILPRNAPEPMSAPMFLERFDHRTMPTEQVVRTKGDEHWLRKG